MPKQVRFSQLALASGRPHPATLWVADPTDDPEFKKAIGENRILTVHNINVRTKKESGEIGFRKMPNSTYLIFPKALTMQPGTKVIGLKFEQLEDAPVKDPVKGKEAPRKTKVDRVKTVQPAERVTAAKPATKSDRPATFTVTLQFTATVQRAIKVKARTASEAIEAATKQSSKLAPKKPDWQTEALEVKATEPAA